MISIREEALDIMVADAEGSFPDECCGFVMGSEEGNDRNISRVLVVDNSKEGDRRRRFAIAPSDYILAERKAEEWGLQLLGIYHSHPNHPAIPSEHDRIAAQPFFSYFILSVKEGEFEELRSWQLNDALQFEEENLHPDIIKNQSTWQQ